LSLYQELAKLAVRVLKPGGSLVFFVGHIILDEVFNIFHDHESDLKYWWTLAVKHSGHHTKIHPRYVFAEWKPLIWYVKGDQLNDLVISNTIGDYIESTPPSKVLHLWEQSTVEAEHIIKNLTIENQMVLDPMMGSGTTGIAALTLERRFIGIEIDHENFQITKTRLAKFIKNTNCLETNLRSPKSNKNNNSTLISNMYQPTGGNNIVSGDISTSSMRIR
jgi:hypothetical protein